MRGQFAAYLRHELTLGQLAGWAERALLDGEFEPENVEMRSSVNARLGGAGVRAIGLTWDGREDLLWQLGYKVRVEIGPC